MYVFVPKFESGGSFWFDVHDWTLVGMIVGQLTLLGYVTLKGGFKQSPWLLPLLFIVAWYRYTALLQ
jgi:calcium permeable stress-gated cation channel